MILTSLVRFWTMCAVLGWSPMMTIMTMTSTATTTAAAKPDEHPNCVEWAERGECDDNPNYMLVHCATACAEIEDTSAEDDPSARIQSFYELDARDIHGDRVDFDQFRGKVVIITNVASECGYTESHYTQLVQLWSHLQTKPVEILAFPCNQFGRQEPGTPDAIRAFAEQKGVTFRIMAKINVNGPMASKVYKYLKKVAGPSTISWNFATYYVVSPDGQIKAYNGVEPLTLGPIVSGLINEEL